MSATVIQPSKETSKKPSLQQRRTQNFKKPAPSPKGSRRGSLQGGPPRNGPEVAEEVQEVLGGGKRRYAGRAVTVMPSDAGVTKQVSSKRFPSTLGLPSLVSGHGFEGTHL